MPTSQILHIGQVLATAARLAQTSMAMGD